MASSCALSSSSLLTATAAVATTTPSSSLHRHARFITCRTAQNGGFAASELFANKLTVSANSRPLRATNVQRRSATVCKISTGDPIPPAVLKDQDGREVKLSKFKGRPLVLYFYPANETPGCTKQACSFRDAHDEYRKMGATVVGVSGDTPESHKAFKEKYGLPYTLLSDEGNKLRKEWGVPSDFFGALAGRQTYVVNRQGIVQYVYNNQFQPEKHIDETLKILQT